MFPCFKQIKDHLNICEADKKFDFVHDAIKIMKSKFEEYWIKILDKALICHVLDPRFKAHYIDCRLLKKKSVFLIKKLIDIYQTSIDSSPSQPSTSTNIEKKERSLTLMERMISKITNTRENDEDELSTYLKQPPIIYSNEYDILQWWKENNKDLPIMAQIAKDFLSLMPTSVPSEKCFSIGTLTVDKNRTRLHSNTVQELLCLKSWIK